MKKIKELTAVIMTIVMLLTVMPLAGIDFTKASALEASGQLTDTISYTFDEATGTLTISGTGAIPDYLNKCPFYDRYSIKKIIIEDGVTRIGKYTFFYCVNATDITIPDSVTSIGYSAFEHCESLADITIPNSVTSIENNAFYACKSLTSIIVPDSVTSIGAVAFGACTSLKSIKLSNNLTSISGDMFDYCYKLTDITIPDSVTSIGLRAFEKCISLTSITIPASVTNIGTGIFFNCTSLKSITVDENNPVYDSRNNCNAIIETATNTLACGCVGTIIPDSVTSIGEFSFGHCERLANITIPANITSIGRGAFTNCSSLTSITIPDSVTSIGENNVFSNCQMLEKITVDENNPIYDSRNNCNAIIETATNTLVTGCKNTVIPDSVTSIGVYAFCGSVDLAEVKIPDGIISINKFAFKECKNLTCITIPNSVTSIDIHAFMSCSSLADVYFNGTEQEWNKITIGSDNNYLLNANIHFIYGGYLEHTIEDGKAAITGIISDSAPTKVVIPSEIDGCPVTKIYGREFCNNILEQTSESISWDRFVDLCPLTGVKSFFYIDDETIGVKGSRSITIPDSVTSIGSFAFMDYDLKSLTIPETVTDIEDYAFLGCYTLESVTLPENKTSIGKGEYLFCQNLKTVKISGRITSIGDSAFEECSSLTDVYFCGTEEEWNAITIGSGNDCLLNANIHFNYCNFLEYTISNGEVTITGCNGLTPAEVVIPAEIEDCPVTTIAYKAFYGNEKITSVTIPATVTTIKSTLSIVVLGVPFGNCPNLTTIIVDENNPVFDSRDNCNAIIKTDTNVLVFGCQSTVIPETVLAIGNGAFACCENLKSLTIPDKVTNIHSYAFARCKDLETLTIGSGMQTISTNAFSPKLQSGCGVDDVYYNGTEEDWNEISIGDNNKDLLNANIHFIGGPAADACDYLEYSILDGKASITGYNDLTPDKLVIPSTIKGFPVTMIYDRAFCDTRLESENATTLLDDDSALLDTWLSLIMPSMIGELIGIEDGEIIGLKGTKSITIPDSVTRIGSFAFVNYGISSLTIPESVTYVENYAFAFCVTLENLTFSESQTSIGEGACLFCKNLKTVTIPKNITSIGDDAFDECPSLTDVYYNGTEEEWNAIAIGSGNSALSKANIHCIDTPADYTAVFSAIAYADGLNPNDYTDESWALLMEAINDVVYDLNYAHQNEVDAMAAAIFAAIDALDTFMYIPELDFSEIDELINEVAGLNEHDYTPESWANLERAINAVTALYSGSITQPVVYDAVAALRAAIDALEKVHTHTFKHYLIPSTCAEQGMEYDTCDECGETINENPLPLAEHTWGEWIRTLDPTTEEEGIEERTCSVCGAVETRFVEKLNEIVDEATGVSVVFSGEQFPENVAIDVVEATNAGDIEGAALSINGLSLDRNAISVIYDITPTVDGEKVQPTGKVKIRVPLPENFDKSKNIFAIYVDPQNATTEKSIKCTVVDGFAEFEVSHFSRYAIYQLIKTVRDVKLPDISLKYNEVKVLSPTITADDGVNYTVRYESYDNSIAVVDRDGTIHANGSGKTSIRCIVTDEYGNTESDIFDVTVGDSFIQHIFRVILSRFFGEKFADKIMDYFISLAK